MRIISRLLNGTALALLVPVTQAWAVNATELGAALKRHDPVTLIDVRSTDVFANGHIPGAINVPAPIVGEKRLPKLGKVVVYDDGLGTDKATDAAAKLNQKPGIAAEVLRGGFSAWETLNAGESTRQPGSKEETLPRITYKELKALPGQGLILVDLRTSNSVPTKTAKSMTSSGGKKPVQLSDLHTVFPGARVTTSAFEPANQAKSAAETAPLVVLIDNGDGTAEVTARQLRANGVRRFTILAGGEKIIARDGMPGKQRLGATVSGPVPMQSLTSGQ